MDFLIGFPFLLFPFGGDEIIDKDFPFTSVQPLHRELYTMHPSTFFVPSFLKAISDNTQESFRKIISEPSPSVFTFEMLQPHFCELLLAEVITFEVLQCTFAYVFLRFYFDSVG